MSMKNVIFHTDEKNPYFPVTVEPPAMRFEKISYEQWRKDFHDVPMYCGDSATKDAVCKAAYDHIQLPKRGTPGSAGYDFYLPYTMTERVRELSNEYNDNNYNSGTLIMLPTGIRWIVENVEEPVVLKLYIRSSMAVKRGFHLANGTGIIDADYYLSKNEGHIMIPLVVPQLPFVIDELQTRIVQGIISDYYTVDNDAVVEDERNGGFGSTGE